VLLGHVVDDVEDAEAPAAGERVMDNVNRPARDRLGLDQKGRPHTDGLAPRPPLAHAKPFFAIQPVDAVDA
jgi:hypothetical protein